MSRRWRIGVPLLVGAAVFGIGAAIEIDSLTWVDWLFVTFGGVIIPTGLLAFAYFVPFRAARNYLRYARYGVPQPEDDWYKGPHLEPLKRRRAEREAAAYTIFGMAPTGLAVGALAFTLWLTVTPIPHPPWVWLLTAVLVALVTRSVLVVASQRVRVRTAFAAVAALLVCAIALPLWKAIRDRSQYHMLVAYASRGYGERRAADRLITFRSDDWRGYAWRVVGRIEEMELDARRDFHHLQGKNDYEAMLRELLPDIEMAVRLGCDAPEMREKFADVYEALGRYAEAAVELRAAFDLGLADGAARRFKARSFCTHKLGWAHLHNGDYASAVEAFRSVDSSQEGGGLAQMALGRYAEALKLLGTKSDSSSQTTSLAWLLATCPDATIRDPARALEMAQSVKPTERWTGMRDSDLPMWPRPYGGWTPRTGEVMAQRGKAFVLAAAYTNLDRFEEAAAAFKEATEKGGLGVSGFWKPRREELAECIKNRRPYRERPAK